MENESTWDRRPRQDIETGLSPLKKQGQSGEGRKEMEEKLLQGCGLQIGAQGRNMSTWGPGEKGDTDTGPARGKKEEW